MRSTSRSQASLQRRHVPSDARTPNPPNVDGARETARRTIRDGNRAWSGHAVACAIGKEFTLEPLDLNEPRKRSLRCR